MKKLLRNLSMLTLMIIGGAQMAWAATEKYDFAAFVAGGTPNLTLSSTEVKQEGTNAKTVYVVNNPTNTSGTLDLKGRIALDIVDTQHKMRWMWRANNKDAYKNGLGGAWNGENLTPVTSINISILGLYAGDKVTVTYAIRSGKPAQLHACSAGIISPDGTAGNALAAAAEVKSNTTYTVLKDGNLDMYVINDNMAIQKIVIESDHIAESISAPAISVVGANLGDRIVSIESNKTNTGAATVTYYTLDGTDPTTSSTKYEGNITVTDKNAVEGTVTIKAITYKEGNTNIASDIRTLILTEVGTTLTLNAPVINMMNFKENGSYYSPVYSFVSDQSSVVGKPEATISYSINRGSSVNGNSYTASTKGELTVTVSAAGYTSASVSTTIDNFIFDRTFYSDFTSFKEHSDVTVGTQTKLNNEGCQAYQLSSDAVEGITITNMPLLWAITKNEARGLYARTGTGSIEYNGSFPAGSYAVFSNNGTAVVSKTAKTEFAQYGLARDMAVYVPAVTISLPADYIYSTFSSELDLDFTGNADVEAYIAYSNDGKNVKLEKVTKVPAETGLVLKKLNAATTATVPVLEDISSITENELEVINNRNRLVAVLEPCSVEDLLKGEGDAYILESDTKFSKVVAGVTTGVLAAGKAFLLYNAIGGGSTKMNILDGEATAIKGVEVKATRTDNAVYNLQGVRVNKPTANGLYIINGKKYLHK